MSPPHTARGRELGRRCWGSGAHRPPAFRLVGVSSSLFAALSSLSALLGCPRGSLGLVGEDHRACTAPPPLPHGERSTLVLHLGDRLTGGIWLHVMRPWKLFSLPACECSSETEVESCQVPFLLLEARNGPGDGVLGDAMRFPSGLLLWRVAWTDCVTLGDPRVSATAESPPGCVSLYTTRSGLPTLL